MNIGDVMIFVKMHTLLPYFDFSSASTSASKYEFSFLDGYCCCSHDSWNFRCNLYTSVHLGIQFIYSYSIYIYVLYIYIFIQFRHKSTSR